MHSNEVMAVITTPVQSEKQGHDVSGGGTTERTFCPIKRIRLNRRTRKHLGDETRRSRQWCDRFQESLSLSAIVIPGQHRGGGPCGRGVRDPSVKHTTRK